MSSDLDETIGDIYHEINLLRSRVLTLEDENKRLRGDARELEAQVEVLERDVDYHCR